MTHCQHHSGFPTMSSRAAHSESRCMFVWLTITGKTSRTTAPSLCLHAWITLLVWCLCHRTLCASGSHSSVWWKKKVCSVRGRSYLELALRLLLRARVPRDWNAGTVTEGHMHSPHCESKPKLCFIRLLSLQRLSHHSINTLVSPLQICFPSSFFFLFSYTWKCSGSVPTFWCGSLFCTLAQQTTQ